MPDWLRLFVTPPLLEIELRLVLLAGLFLLLHFLLQFIARQIARRLEKIVPDLDRRVRLQTLLRVGRDGLVVALLFTSFFV